MAKKRAIGRSGLPIGSTTTVGGKKFRITASNRKGKKKKACPVNGKGPCYHFGAKGYTIRPGTARGDNYCSRSLGIKSDRISPNSFARKDWNCQGKKSIKK